MRGRGAEKSPDEKRFEPRTASPVSALRDSAAPHRLRDRPSDRHVRKTPEFRHFPPAVTAPAGLRRYKDVIILNGR
jgi:hypothetical protein